MSNFPSSPGPDFLPRRTLLWWVAIALPLLILGALPLFMFPGQPSFSSSRVASMVYQPETEGFGDGTIKTPPAATHSNTGHRGLMTVLRRARKKPDHKCPDVATLVIHYYNGKSDTVQFLQGHQADHAEFRFGGKLYQADRAELFRAFGVAGFDTTPLTEPASLE